MHRNRSTVLPVAVIAALATVVGTALAGVEKFDSRTTVKTALPLYHGQVKADAPQCVRNRRVVLFESRSGPDRKLGGDRTDRRGRWKVKVAVDVLEPQDRFYAKARRKLNIVSGDGFVCRGDVSKTVTFIGD